MKKIIPVVMLLFVVFNTQAQYSEAKPETKKENKIQDCGTKLKKGKPLFLASGASFIIGSVINYSASQAKIPNASEFTTTSSYNAAMDSYSRRQKNSRQATALLYGIGGLTLAVGAAISF